jgi:hypothetical protein
MNGELSLSKQRELHFFSVSHRKEILAAPSCGCFYCESIFAPDEIFEWIDSEGTALCPKCSIDSVIPSTCDQDFGPALLNKMKKYWF